MLDLLTSYKEPKAAWLMEWNEKGIFVTVCLLYFGDKSVQRGEPNLMKPSFGTFRDVLIWKNKLNSGLNIL